MNKFCFGGGMRGSTRKNWMAMGIAMLLFVVGGIPALAAPAEIVATGLQFPEGAIFVGRSLYFVDYAASGVFRLEGAQPRSVWHQDRCGANGLLQVPQGLLVACYDANTVIRIGLDGKTIETLSQDSAGQTFDHPNDLAADANGGVYFTASGSDSEKSGKIYYLKADGVPRQVAAGIGYANGIAVAPGGKQLYVAESSADRILRFDISADGSLGKQYSFVDLNIVLAANPGNRHTPDGIRIDKHGHILAGLYRGGGVAVFDTDGRLISQVDLPGQHHASLAIAPGEEFIYGTISNDTLTSGYSGALYRVRNPAVGH
jgi:gluconolactonase